MMKLCHLFENFDLAKYALSLYDYDLKKTEELLPFFRISSNAIYPFYHQEKVCFLRLTPIDENNYESICAEIEIINYLFANQFPTMEVVKTKDNQQVSIIQYEQQEYTVVAFYRVPGKALDNVSCDKEIIYEYGKTLGKLHSLLTQFKPVNKRVDYHDLIINIQDNLLNYDNNPTILAKLKEVEENLQLITVNSNTFGLIHYDFEPDNVFYDINNKKCYVIDFGDCLYCFNQLDIVKSISCFDDIVSDDLMDQAIDTFIKGYQEEHILTKEQINSFPLMKQLIDLNSYAKIKRSLYDILIDEPDWMKDIRIKLNNKLKILEKRILKG